MHGRFALKRSRQILNCRRHAVLLHRGDAVVSGAFAGVHLASADHLAIGGFQDEIRLTSNRRLPFKIGILGAVCLNGRNAALRTLLGVVLLARQDGLAIAGIEVKAEFAGGAFCQYVFAICHRLTDLDQNLGAKSKKSRRPSVLPIRIPFLTSGLPRANPRSHHEASRAFDAWICGLVSELESICSEKCDNRIKIFFRCHR